MGRSRAQSRVSDNDSPRPLSLSRRKEEKPASPFSSSELKALRTLGSSSSPALRHCFANALVTLLQHGITRDEILNDFPKELKILFSSKESSVTVKKAILQLLQWLVASERVAPLFLRDRTLIWLVKVAMDPPCTIPVLEILLRVTSHSRLREHIYQGLARAANLFGLLANKLTLYVNDYQRHGKDIPSYECCLILDILSYALQGVLISEEVVMPIQSYNVLVDLLEIFPRFHKIGSQTAHLIELIARIMSRGLTCHFRADGMLDRFYQMILSHQQGDPSPRSLLRQQEPCFNVLATFISVLQYYVSSDALEAGSEKRKYFDFFVQLSAQEELHWVIQKPWTGGTVILQKLFTTHWHHFSHLLPLIPYESLVIGEKLGAGTFGTVYRGHWTKESGQVEMVAIKVVDTDSQFFDEMELRRELLLLYFLKHPNLVEFFGGCYHREKHSFIIVTRLYEGSLRAFFQSHTLRDRDKCKIAYDIALGIRHLHNIGVAHRDLKCDNILISTGDGPTSACIADFGIARALIQNEKTARGGTWRYMAPEWIAGLYSETSTNKWGVHIPKERNLSNETSFDIFSFGHIFWALWKEEEPLQGVTDVTIISRACQTLEPILPDTEEMPTSWKRLVEGCWAPQESRFTIDDVINQLQLISECGAGYDSLSASERMLILRHSSKAVEILPVEPEKAPNTPNSPEPIPEQPKSEKRVKKKERRASRASSPAAPAAVALEMESEQLSSLRAALEASQQQNQQLQQQILSQREEMEKQALLAIQMCERSLGDFRSSILRLGNSPAELPGHDSSRDQLSP